MALVDAASKYGQCADSDAECKKSLPHSCKDTFLYSNSLYGSKVRIQVITQPCFRIGKHDGLDGQNEQKAKKKRHHDFCDTLHSLLQTDSANTERENNYKKGTENHG